MSREYDTFSKMGVAFTAFEDGTVVFMFWDKEYRQQIIEGLQSMADDEHYAAFAPKDFDNHQLRANLIAASEKLGDIAPPRTGRPVIGHFEEPEDDEA